MIKKISALLFCAFVFPFFLQAQLQQDMALSYLVSQPVQRSTAPPMLILMHGYGSNEADLFGLKNAMPQNFIVVSLRAPMKLGNDSYQWFALGSGQGGTQGNRKDIDESVAKVKQVIIALVKKYHADPSQVYLSGFSQGGMMSYEVGLTSPELLKGIAPMSGKIYDELKPRIKMSAALKKLSIFIGHGDGDTRVDYSYATQANSYLKQIGLSPVLHTYKGMQHAINEDEVNDLKRWLGGK